MPGCIECGLLRETEHPERYQMVFRWESAEGAVAWRTSPVHQALQPALNELHEGMEIIAYARVA
jgi:heme-degrading monooxygenase HmoA